MDTNGVDPIPRHLIRQFVSLLLQHDDPQLTQIEWLAVLEEQAAKFMTEHNLDGRPRDAVGRYLDWKHSIPAEGPHPGI